jgi:hypothetical protein
MFDFDLSASLSAIAVGMGAWLSDAEPWLLAVA